MDKVGKRSRINIKINPYLHFLKISGAIYYTKITTLSAEQS